MPEALGPIGMDPNQIRQQLSQAWQSGDKTQFSGEAFSQMMWQTLLKETLSFEMMGGEGFGAEMCGDWAKEGFSAAIAAQLARQNPMPFPGAETTSPELSVS